MAFMSLSLEFIGFQKGVSLRRLPHASLANKNAMVKFLAIAKKRGLNVLTVSELDVSGMKLRAIENDYKTLLFFHIWRAFEKNVQEIHIYNVDKLMYDTASYDRFRERCHQSKSLKRVVFERLPKKYYFLDFHKMFESNPFDETVASASDIAQARTLRRSRLQSFIADFVHNKWCIRTFTPFISPFPWMIDIVAFTQKMHYKSYLDNCSDFCSILPDFSYQLSGGYLDYPGVDADVSDVIEAFAGSLERVNLEGVVVRHDTLLKISQCRNLRSFCVDHYGLQRTFLQAVMQNCPRVEDFDLRHDVPCLKSQGQRGEDTYHYRTTPLDDVLAHTNVCEKDLVDFYRCYRANMKCVYLSSDSESVLRQIHLDRGTMHASDVASRILRACDLKDATRRIESLISCKVDADGLSSIVLKQIDAVKFFQSDTDVDDAALHSFLQRNPIRDEVYLENFPEITELSLDSICDHCTQAKHVSVVDCPRALADRGRLENLVRALPNLQSLDVEISEEDRADVEDFMRVLIAKSIIKSYDICMDMSLNITFWR